DPSGFTYRFSSSPNGSVSTSALRVHEPDHVPLPLTVVCPAATSARSSSSTHHTPRFNILFSRLTAPPTRTDSLPQTRRPPFPTPVQTLLGPSPSRRSGTRLLRPSLRPPPEN